MNDTIITKCLRYGMPFKELKSFLEKEYGDCIIKYKDQEVRLLFMELLIMKLG